MTDPTPNNLPMPKPLSPAAQAVLDAFRAEWPDEALKQDCKCLAAALCALADQVEPDDGISAEVRQVLNKILAIATELEGHV